VGTALHQQQLGGLTCNGGIVGGRAKLSSRTEERRPSTVAPQVVTSTAVPTIACLPPGVVTGARTPSRLPEQARTPAPTPMSAHVRSSTPRFSVARVPSAGRIGVMGTGTRGNW
jgi:hypothetical protein